MRKFVRFLKRTLKSAFNSIRGFVIDLVDNTESVAILTLATVGTTAVLQELAMFYPIAILDIPMMIPILAALTIYLLATSLAWRQKCGYVLVS